MRKGLGLFSIICKNELESNFDKILEVIKGGVVDELAIAKIVTLWGASLELTQEFVKVQSFWQDETLFAQSNIKLHFRNHLKKTDSYQSLYHFLKSPDFCGWVAQVSCTSKLNPGGHLERQMIALINTLSDYDAHMVHLKRQHCLQTYSSTLDGNQIHKILCDTAPHVIDTETCRSHVESTLKKTPYQISESTLIHFLLFIPFILFLYSLTFELYPGLILSLFTMTLLQSQFQNSLENDSMIEKAAQQAIEAKVYAREKPDDEMIKAVKHFRTQSLKIRSMNLKEPPVRFVTTCIPSAPALTKEVRQDIHEENGLELVHER